MTAIPSPPRRRRWWVVVAVGIALAVGGPFLLREVKAPDASAPSWIAPYVDVARERLLDVDDLGLPQFRFVGARCSGDAVALLFERRSYPFLSHAGSIAVTNPWPPDGPGSFSGSLFVDDFDEGLRAGWDPALTWGECEAATAG